MLDVKALKLALEQLETERKIPQGKILEAIEFALAAAYKKEYAKKDQIIRAHFDLSTGTTTFEQVKLVVDESMVRIVEEGAEDEHDENDERVRFNQEKHIMIADAGMIKTNAKLDDEIVFALEAKDDFGRIAAQTAKQVIMQKIREAERGVIMDEYGSKEGEIVNGTVQKVERGVVYIEFSRAVGVLPPEEQIPGERWNPGDRIRAYLYSVEEGMRGVSLRLSRTHRKFLEAIFAMEVPEIASGVVEIKSIIREPGSRSKIAVFSADSHVDPTGACIGSRGVRVNAVTNELHGEKIDVIEWSDDAATFIANSLSPAKVLDLKLLGEEHKAIVDVAEDQLSLAIGKAGQNVRLAAKLTGWKIDIKGIAPEVTIGAEEKEEAQESIAEVVEESIEAASQEEVVVPEEITTE